jgi:rubrerythrin
MGIAKGGVYMTYDSDYEDEDGLGIDLEMLREDLIGELQAINQYQEHIDTMEDEEAVRVLEHILDDEKEHVAELTKLIQKLDATQAEKFRKEGL